MHDPIDRRLFVRTSAVFLAGVSLSSLSAQTPPSAPKAPPKPPALPADKIKAVVVESHRSLEAVQKLVEETPLLVNACWDWGGGDFETPLEATAHTGRREIAEFLLSKGARPTVYAAGMLGQLGVVQAFFALHPKIHEVPGPHGFTLYHCVKQGGATAKPVLDWLTAQGVPASTNNGLPYVWPAGTEPPKAG